MPILKVRDPNTGQYIPILGGSSGGPDEVTIDTSQPATPTDLWVDTDDPVGSSTLYVMKAGDTMTGPLNMGNSKITNVASPTLATDVATKDYVDTSVVEGTVTFSSGWRAYTNRPCRLHQHGGMVTLEANFQPTTNLAISANVGVVMAVLQVGFRPVGEMTYPAIVYTGPSGTPVRTYYPAMVYPSTNGNVAIYLGTAITLGTDGTVFVNPTFRQGN